MASQAQKSVGLAHLAPVAASLLLSWIFSTIMLVSQVEFQRPVILPLPEPSRELPPEVGLASEAPYLNTLIFILLILGSGAVLAFAIRRFPKIVKYVAIITYSLAALSISYLYASLVLFVMGVDVFGYELLVGVLGGSLLIASMISRVEMLKLLSASAVGSGVGTYLGFSVPLWTALILIVAISLYDIYAVYKGPIKTLVKSDVSELPALVVPFRDIFVGLGDLVFYSMLVSFSIWNFSAFSGLAASLGIVLGFVLTLKRVSSHGVTPGLPASLLTGLLLALLASAA